MYTKGRRYCRPCSCLTAPTLFSGDIEKEESERRRIHSGNWADIRTDGGGAGTTSKIFSSLWSPGIWRRKLTINAVAKDLQHKLPDARCLVDVTGGNLIYLLSTVVPDTYDTPTFLPSDTFHMGPMSSPWKQSWPQLRKSTLGKLLVKLLRMEAEGL